MQLSRSIKRLRVFGSHLSSAAAVNATKYDYDLIVVGGGSGGLACSREAASLGKKVAVLDYVRPSPRGTTWGLGGTCVNVGCIPKKLMHHAALLGQNIRDAAYYGWSVPSTLSHSWNTLTEAVNDHIKSLNWGYRVDLQKKKVDYFNMMGKFVDQHTVEVSAEDKPTSRLSAKYFVIAVGGRPFYPSEVAGAEEFGITSDDLFTLKDPPGKTLVVGGSYVAAECAGFLAGLGFNTTLMVRSTPLKSFDQDMVGHVMSHMTGEGGVRLMSRCAPREVQRLEDKKLLVTWLDSEQNRTLQEEWDTVVFATGRRAQTDSLGLSALGVEVESHSHKILTNEMDAATVDSVFAIGDVANNRRELTPVAIKAGKLLARRLFSGSQQLMDYDLVPTTLFTPLELGSIGLTEQEAIESYGLDNIEVYHAIYTPLEFYIPQRPAGDCYIKMVCVKGEAEKVVGMHVTGPNAGEITQGFAVAIGLGLTRAALEASVGIHPTCAEEVIKLNITKSSGLSPQVTGC